MKRKEPIAFPPLRWHVRRIEDIASRLYYLRGLIDVTVTHNHVAAPDVSLCIRATMRRICVEVQQAVSGTPWRTTTIAGWAARHDLATFVLMPRGALECVIRRIETDDAYRFFRRKDVYLFGEDQLSEMISTIGLIVLLNAKGRKSHNSRGGEATRG